MSKQGEDLLEKLENEILAHQRRKKEGAEQKFEYTLTLTQARTLVSHVKGVHRFYWAALPSEDEYRVLEMHGRVG